MRGYQRQQVGVVKKKKELSDYGNSQEKKVAILFLTEFREGGFFFFFAELELEIKETTLFLSF